MGVMIVKVQNTLVRRGHHGPSSCIMNLGSILKPASLYYFDNCENPKEIFGNGKNIIKCGNICFV